MAVEVIETTASQIACPHKCPEIEKSSYWVKVQTLVRESDGRKRTHICYECFAKKVK